MKGKGFQFFTIILTLLALFIVNNWLLSNIAMSIVSSITGNDGLITTLIAYNLSNLIIGILACIPLYLQMRDDGVSHRLLLQFFQQNEYTPQNMKKFLKGYRINILVFFISMMAVLIFQYGLDIFIVPTSAMMIFVPYLVLELAVRPKLFAKWYEERLHR